ncbi:MAG: hypothetical protein AUJ28_03065 [Parcubacteria group bacterium CG1_02_37_51]|uniref:Major facilitator superfamily (MFS) profile domain-containing protein n=2 Tax=Candidatus Komeiliibacteriota TaxID=1817908 RepID=A0A2M8DRT0_9BACT|nr:MAG: hypothetical protein AUJ28_03065 [Parcubacteria group bacterium CG1_02_37_51]PIY95272.1 MAG: hypothetical protein COY67_00895 [Candidatus Komeilibacteria bacterium CG_4_10_14_0_8_um_filter_37_78]PJC02083.1 MAG: hypothetical protein CO073_01375 [Candidatus Komeilibacteria bacterium CG_4_9_14_0_8_um_filter_36_9]
MINKFHHLLSYLPQKMKTEVRELYASALILYFGLALIFIFEPIYLYRLGYSLQQIMMFWVIVYAVYIFILPLGGKVAERFGYEHTIFYGTFFWILLYLCMYLIQYWPIFFFITPIVWAIQKSLYWPAYHANFAKYSGNQEEGREISFLTILTSASYVVGPIFGGFILYFWGFSVLFIVVAILLLVSNVPMLLTKEKFKPVPVDYQYSFKRMFAKENRKQFLAYMGFGEEILVVVVWPIFISIFITSYLSIGWLVGVATLITALVTLFIGKWADRINKREILKIGVSFYSLSWVLRLIIAGPWSIFFTDTLSRASKNTINVPLQAITYENAKNYTIMNTVLMFEMSLAIGKLIACLAALILVSLFSVGLIPFYIIFAMAGAITWLYVLL